MLNASLVLRRPKKHEPEHGDITTQIYVEKSNVSDTAGVRTHVKEDGEFDSLVLKGPGWSAAEEEPDDGDD
jgi:hypothetical protein